jgi:hypothetical protein
LEYAADEWTSLKIVYLQQNTTFLIQFDDGIC